MHPSKQTNILNYENFEILIFLFTQPLINEKNLANLILYIYIYIYSHVCFLFFLFMENKKQNKILFKLINNFI